MNLLFPAFLGAVGAIGLPVILHLLRTRTQKQLPFPSLRFLGEWARRDSRRHSLMQWLVLLLRCLLVVLIVLAFTRPYWRLAHTDESRSVVVVIDNSYSMQAQGRSEAMQNWLTPRLAKLRPPDQLGVLVLQPTPTWIVPLGANLAAARDAAAKPVSSYDISNYRPGLDLAATALSLATTKHREILLAGDQQRLGWSGVRFDRTLPPGIELLTAPVAPMPKSQAAVTAFTAKRSQEGELGFDVTVESCVPTVTERSVTFYAGDTKIGSAPITVSSSKPTKLHVTFPTPSDVGPLALRAVLDPDELPVDNTAYAALPAANSHRVALARLADARQVDYVDRALRAVHSGDTLPSFSIESLPPNTAPWPTAAVAVLRGAEPFTGTSVKSLDAFLDAGASAWVLCDGSAEQATWLATQGVKVVPARPVASAATLKLRDFALDHPLFSAFDGYSLSPLFEPTFNQGWALEGASLEPLARWSDGTIAVAEVPVGSGRLLVTGFSLTREESDLPIRTAFVPFVHRAVTWLGESAPELPSGRVGSVLNLPGAGTWRPVLSPQPGSSIDVDGFVTPTAPGIYEFKHGETREWYAVNLDTSESNLEPWPVPSDFARLNSGKPAPEVTTAVKASTKLSFNPTSDDGLVDERQVWWWLLAAAVVLLFLELGLSNRTVL